MLAAYANTEKHNTSFVLLGAKSLLSSSKDSKAETSASVAFNTECGFDSCSFVNIFAEPTGSYLLTFAGQYGVDGLVVYNGSESCGSVAYSGSESCGSVASCGGFSSGASSAGCGGCSYSC